MVDSEKSGCYTRTMDSSASPLSVKSYKLPALNKHAGFTLVELVIYIALTAVVAGLFAGILVTTTRLQNKQGSSASLVQEMSFLSSTLQRYIHSASDFSVSENGELTVIINPLTVPPTTKKISLADPGVVALSETDPTNGTVQSILSSNDIHIDELIFTERSQGASKSITMRITASASTTNPQKAASHTIESTAALYLQEQ